MREKGQTEAAKTLETPVFSRGIEILTEPANKKSRGNEVKIGERRGEKKGYSKQIAAKASIKKSGSSTAC